MKKYILMPLRMSIASKKGILVGPKVLSVASQTVLLHILGSRGSHIFLQIDHEVISKVILTPSAAQLQTFKNMTFFKMSKYDIRPDFECQNRILNVKVRYSASVRMPNMILNVKIRYSAHFRISKRILNVVMRLRPNFECQNRILNVKIRYSAAVRTTK